MEMHCENKEVGSMKTKTLKPLSLSFWGGTLCVCCALLCANTLSNVQSHYYVYYPPFFGTMSPPSTDACWEGKGRKK